MHRNFSLPVAVVSSFLTLGTASAAPADPFAVQPIFEQHCVECHGPDTKKAGLRLDTLGTDLTDSASMTMWTKIHDHIRSGEMPPKSRDPLPAKDRSAVLARLDKALHTASLSRQKVDGRAVLRRLNNTEYENTIRDLVGTSVNVRDLLPDDNSAAGFDNVGTVLELSATHILRYQDAAERAIRSAIPPHPPIPFENKRTGKEMSEKGGGNFRQTLGRSCRVDGDALIVHSVLPRYGLAATQGVPSTGRYRVRMSISAMGEKPVPVGFMTVGTDREGPFLKSVRDVPPGKPTVIETEIDLQARHSFVVNMLTKWDIRGFKKPIEEYTGPGFRIEWMEISGPLGDFPPASYQSVFGDIPLKARSVAKAEAEGKKVPDVRNRKTPQQWVFDPLIPAPAAKDAKSEADRLIRAFLPRAFRRPVSEELAKKFVARVHAKLDAGTPFLEAMIFGYKSILSSPHFLMLLDPSSGDADPKLDEYALASRLSYFLWSGPPDAELLAVADKGKLGTPEGLRTQTERLLKDPKSHRFTDNFTGQWLDLRKIDDTIPDPQLYGEFDDLLLWSMPQETRQFFEEILRNDRSLLEFTDSDWTMANERLAKLYGIPDVSGNEMRKVKLPPGSHRGGVMTQAAVLKVTADGTRTSPVLRGVWVLDKILGLPPSPPPPDVPALEPDIRGATTIRQQLDKHRTIASCATCHVKIDPPGFALESFDPIGNFRSFYRATAGDRKKIVPVPFHTSRPVYRGPDVECASEMAGGRKFADIDGFKKLLLADPDQLARNLAEKLIVYSTGADIQYADREVVEKIVEAVKSKKYGFRTLIHEVVQSRAFRNK